LFAILKEVKKYIPDFRSCILDLSVFKPELINDSPLSVADCCEGLGPPSVAGYCGGRCKFKMLLLALKYSRSPDILRTLPQIIRISEKIPGGDYDYLKVVLTYLASVINNDQFWKIVAKEHSGGEIYMETIADLLREEERLKREKIERTLRKEIEQNKQKIEQKDTVIEQNKQKIEQKNAVIKQISIENKERFYHIIQRMLKKGMSWKTIREITGFSNEEIEHIINDIKRDNYNKEV